MMDLMTITGTSDQGTLICDALCAAYKYPETITDEAGESVDNPETKAVFAERMIRETYLRAHVRAYRKNNHERTTSAQVIADADAELEGVSVQLTQS